MPRSPSFREMLAAQSGPLTLAGCFDALGARLLEAADFEAVYMTGFGTAAALLGRPDIGLLSSSEMVDNARRIAESVTVPVFADADTGYGTSLNVMRTVQSFSRAGVSAIHIEDQVMPKRCGHMAGKEVVDADEFAMRLRSAIAAETPDDIMIFARTDAAAPLGFDEARRRAATAVELGADGLFVEALTTPEQVVAIADEFAGVPLIYNWVEDGKSPPMTYEELDELGFAIVLAPVTLVLAAARAMRDAAEALRTNGTPATIARMGFAEFVDTMGLDELRSLEQQVS